MKFSIIISFIFIFCSQASFGQFLKEQEWSKLSAYITSNDMDQFESYLKEKGFSKTDEDNQKYTFYAYKDIAKNLYAVRLNHTSKQVTYMTNNQNYVLKLVSRFMEQYQLIKSEKKGVTSRTHIFKSTKGTIAVKLDLSTETGTHLLFAKPN